MELTSLITNATLILQSQFALSLILLVAFVVLSVWTRRTINRTRQEMKIAFLECQADGAMDKNFIKTLRSLCFEYRLLYVSAVGGKRTPSPMLKEIDERFDEIRREMHAENKLRIQRLRDRADDLLKENDKQNGSF